MYSPPLSYLDVFERDLPRPDSQPPGGRAQIDVYLRHPDGEHTDNVARQEKRRMDVEERGQKEEARNVYLALSPWTVENMFEWVGGGMQSVSLLSNVTAKCFDRAGAVLTVVGCLVDERRTQHGGSRRHLRFRPHNTLSDTVIQHWRLPRSEERHDVRGKLLYLNIGCIADRPGHTTYQINEKK